MALSVVMPALEMAQETGKLLAWLKKEGESVKKGEPLLEIETDKVTLEVEAPGDGVLAGVRAREGTDVPVGQTIAWIVAPGEKPPADAASAGPGARGISEQTRAAVAASAAAAPTTVPAREVKASPKARRLAKELGVDLSRVVGKGPGGVINAEDVELAAKSQTAAPAATAAAAKPAPVRPTPPQPAATQAIEQPGALSAISRLMAERTTQSWTTTPHFFVARDIDASALVAGREWLGPVIERAYGVKLTHTDLLVAIAARVLANHPKMNASWTGNAIRFNPDVNISVAMAVKDGVVGAVIAKAGTLSLGDIAVRRRDLTERARSGHLHPPDVAGGTFTISNLGMYGVDAFSAIITPPQTAILAVGRIADRVVPVDGKPGIRPMMTITLSSDHRVVDGAQAAVFLNDLAEAVREPQKWLS